jgi:RNAse (barnase) inhibitor barstar
MKRMAGIVLLFIAVIAYGDSSMVAYGKSGLSKYLILVEPANDEMPSSVLQTLKDTGKVGYLIKEIQSSEVIKQTFELFAYSAQVSSKPNKTFYLAMCGNKSPVGVPFVQHYTGKYWFKLDGDKTQGSVFFLPINDEYGDQESIKTAAFQTGFIHEVGHIVLANLVPDFPQREVQSEGVSSITDPNVAFDEGFAELFEIFFMFRMPQYKSGHFLENIPFWHQVEFGYFRSFGVLNNMFVWDEWGNKTLKKIDSQGIDIFLNGKLLPMKKLRTQKDMLACEGVVVRVLLDIIKAQIETDTGKKIDIQKYDQWDNIREAFQRLMKTIAKYKVTDLQALWNAIVKDPAFADYLEPVWKAYLEDSYYAFGSADYAKMYQKYNEKKITAEEYQKWKDEIFAQNMANVKGE